MSPAIDNSTVENHCVHVFPNPWIICVAFLNFFFHSTEQNNIKVACWILNVTKIFSCLLPLKEMYISTCVPFSVWSARYTQAVNTLIEMSGYRSGSDWALVGDALITCHRSEAKGKSGN